MTIERDRKMMVMYKRGVPVRDIAKTFGLDRKSVTRIRSKMGVPPRRRDWNKLDPVLRRMAQDPDATMTDMAKALDLSSEQVVRRRLSKLGITTMRPFRVSKLTEDQKTIMRGLYPWSTNEAVAGVLGWPTHAVQRIGRLMELKKHDGLRYERASGYRRQPPGTLSPCGRYINGGPRHMTVNRWLWEQAGNDEPPEGHVIAVKLEHAHAPPAQRTVDMLEVIPLKEVIQRNSIRQYPLELQRAIIDLNKLKRSLNK